MFVHILLYMCHVYCVVVYTCVWSVWSEVQQEIRCYRTNDELHTSLQVPCEVLSSYLPSSVVAA